MLTLINRKKSSYRGSYSIWCCSSFCWVSDEGRFSTTPGREWCVPLAFCGCSFIHARFTYGFVFVVWSCLGAHKHCVWYLGEYQSGDWPWRCANFCKASGFSKWWCSWAGMLKDWQTPILYRLKLCWLVNWLYFFPNYRLCGHSEMLLVTLLGAVILFLVMGRWFLCCLSWMSMPSFQCWEMLHGPYQTFVEASLNLHLSRLAVVLLKLFYACSYLIQNIVLFLILQSASCWWSSYLVKWNDLLNALHDWWQYIYQVRPALSALQRLVHSNDEEVLTDACWALSYLSDGTNDKIQAVIEAGVCPRLVELLMWVECSNFLSWTTFLFFLYI